MLASEPDTPRRHPLPVLEAEADPASPNVTASTVEPRPDLVRSGWTRRFVAEPPRLAEAVALYTGLGFEIHLEPVPGDSLASDCNSCAPALRHARILYTRRRS